MTGKMGQNFACFHGISLDNFAVNPYNWLVHETRDMSGGTAQAKRDLQIPFLKHTKVKVTRQAGVTLSRDST